MGASLRHRPLAECANASAPARAVYIEDEAESEDSRRRSTAAAERLRQEVGLVGFATNFPFQLAGTRGKTVVQLLSKRTTNCVF